MARVRYLSGLWRSMAICHLNRQLLCKKPISFSACINLKVPKRENFSLAFFAQSEPIWVCDLGSGEKNRFFYQMMPDFEG